MTRSRQTTEINATDVRSLRRAAGWTMGELARRVGLSETDLRKFERGLELPGPLVVERVAEALGVSPASIRQAQAQLCAQATTGEGYRTAIPASSFVQRPAQRTSSGSIPILDLFCGTGGFSLGFEQSGRFQVVAGIDLLADRVATFAANHPTSRVICSDLRVVPIDELLRDCPRPEVVIGGPPCQGFSSIRPFRNLTESDPRNNLFEQFALVVDAIRPAWFVMENVVGLITSQKGQTLEAILGVFSSIGYALDWRVLNAAFYGLPQRRERFILVGSRDQHSFAWPDPTHYFAGAKSMAGRHGQHHRIVPSEHQGLHEANTVMDAIHDLPEVAAGESSEHYLDSVEPTEYVRELRGETTKLTLHEATRHSPKMLSIIRHAGFNKAALPPGMVKSGFSTCYSRLEPHLPSVTLTVNFVHPASNKCIHPFQDRALTPREGARLQGFPDSFEFVGNRAQVVKQIGNAVPPLLGRIIAASLANHMV